MTPCTKRRVGEAARRLAPLALASTLLALTGCGVSLNPCNRPTVEQLRKEPILQAPPYATQIGYGESECSIEEGGAGMSRIWASPLSVSEVLKRFQADYAAQYSMALSQFALNGLDGFRVLEGDAHIRVAFEAAAVGSPGYVSHILLGGNPRDLPRGTRTVMSLIVSADNRNPASTANRP